MHNIARVKLNKMPIAHKGITQLLSLNYKTTVNILQNAGNNFTYY